MYPSRLRTVSIVAAMIGLFCGGIVAFSATEDRPDTDPRLLGRWEVVSVKARDGKDTLFSGVDRMVFSQEATFGTKPIPSRLLVELKDGRLLVFDYTLRLSDKPQAIDVVFEKSGTFQTFQGIFKIEGESLQLCMSASNEDRPTAFSVQDGTDQVLLVLRGEKKAK